MISDKPMSDFAVFSGESFDRFQLIQLALTPLCVVYSFSFTVPLVLKRIVEEKQKGKFMYKLSSSLYLYPVGQNLYTYLGT